MDEYIKPGDMIAGTCGNCGGPVTTPWMWMGTTPPPKRCARCGATAADNFGPTMPMNPGPPPVIRTTTNTAGF